jgi:hypothetical protein
MVFVRYRVSAQISGEDGRRLRELEEAAGVRGLQPEEIAEMRQASPDGIIRL